jgi:hypothetical protein
LDELLIWVKKHGGIFHPVVVKDDPKMGKSMFASKDLKVSGL